jgi:hypothetical protein
MREGSDREDSRNMMWLFGQFLMTPVAAFLYGVNMLLRTMQGMQQVTSQGVEVMMGPNALLATTAGKDVLEAPLDASMAVNTDSGDNRITNKEETKLNGSGPKMTDPNQAFCNPNQPASAPCLILWRYKVLFIKRDLEHAFPEKEDLIPNDVTDITAWKIAEFVQQMGQCLVPVPHKWRTKRFSEKYWKLNCSEQATESQIDDAIKQNKPIYLTGLDEDDKKFLRLFSQQMASYPRQDPKYEEHQIAVLEQIRDRIR